MATGPRHVIAALRSSHDRLVTLVEELPEGGVSGPSYCDEWSIAQVLSHLGSGAEIGLANLDSALAGEPAPERQRYLEIWARWDALSPEEMVSNAILSDSQHVSRWENVDDATLETFRMPSFIGELDATAAVAMRLSEHALHTWDVEVMSDDAATLSDGAVEILAERTADRFGRLGSGPKPELVPTSVAVEAFDPPFALTIEITAEGVSAAGAHDAATTLTIPTEAYIRLAYGRMDTGHTPESAAITGALSLDDLRTLFPGN